MRSRAGAGLPAAGLAAAMLVAAVLGLGCGSSGTAGSPATTTSANSSTNSSTSSSTDPTLDTDGDYLTDVEEDTRGTDPNDPDTDGDAYLDGDEVLEEKDPLDPASRIYVGGWPYQRFKDTLVDPGFAGSAEQGAVIPRLVAIDQFGESVDLYDYSLHGRRVVLDVSALWCGSCKEMATWLEGKPSSFDDKPEYAGIVEQVSSGQLHWVTILFEDAVGNPAGPEHAVAWAEEFPNPAIAVLVDDDRAMYDFIFPGTMPSLTVLDEDMTIRVYDRFDYEVALASLLE